MHKRTIKLYTVKGFAFKSPGVNKLNFVASYIRNKLFEFDRIS